MNNFTPLQAARIAALWQLYRVSAANAEAPAAKGPTPVSPLEGGQGGNQGQNQSAPPLNAPSPRPTPKSVPRPHQAPTRAPVKKPAGDGSRPWSLNATTFRCLRAHRLMT